MGKYAKNSKDEQEREIKSIYRKSQALWESYLKLPKVKLDKPRFVGYKRFYVLRDDIAKRSDALELREILFLINEVRYSKTKDFSEHDVNDPPWHVAQKIQSITKKQFENLNPHQKKFFYEVRHIDFRKKEVRYHFRYDFYFVFKVKQHYLTEVSLLDTEIESQMKELDNKIDMNNLWPKINRLLRGSHNSGYRNHYNEQKYRIMDIIIEKEMQDEMIF